MSTRAMPAVDPRPMATPVGTKGRQRSTGSWHRPPAALSQTAEYDRGGAASPAPSVRGGLLQFQLRRLIGEILAQTDLDPNMRASLLRHLALHPEDPGQALFSHLHDVQAPDDLPPFTGDRKPMGQQPEM
jgi:hypothetical protein